MVDFVFLFMPINMPGSTYQCLPPPARTPSPRLGPLRCFPGIKGMGHYDALPCSTCLRRSIASITFAEVSCSLQMHQNITGICYIFSARLHLDRYPIMEVKLLFPVRRCIIASRMIVILH